MGAGLTHPSNQRGFFQSMQDWKSVSAPLPSPPIAMKLPILALALFCASVAARAQQTPAAPPTATEANAPLPDGTVEFGALQANFNDAKGIGVYTGDVTATQKGEDFILYAQKANSFRDDGQGNTDGEIKTATATDNLRIETRESTIRGKNLFANFVTKVFSVTDDVVVSSYGENDGVAPDAAAKRRSEQKRQPVRIACDRLDWNYDTRQAILVGHIRIVQGDGVGTCNQIIYDETKNAARLLGDVRFGNAEKRQFFANELLLFIDSGNVQVDNGGRVTGPVNNAADPKNPPTPKTVESFPEPATIGDIPLPKPPPDIEKFLPKPGVPTGKPPVIPAEKPKAETTPVAPAKAPDEEPKAEKK